MSYQEMSSEQIGTLADQYRNGDIEARNKVLENNVGLAKSIATNTETLEYDDAVQIAYYGIMRALYYYNPSKGAFSKFAGICIRQELDKATKQERKTSPFHESLNEVAYYDEYNSPTTFQEHMESDVATPYDNELSNENFRCQIQALNQLDKEKQDIIIKRFGLDGQQPKSISQIGCESNRSFDWVKVRLESALSQMQEYIHDTCD